MQRLFAFIFRYRVFLIFIGIEFFCFYLIYSKNNYQKTTLVNSSNAVTGSFLSKKRTWIDYFNLKNQNLELAKENSILKEMLVKNNALNSFSLKKYNKDLVKYKLHSAKVVNNSTHLQNNFITLNIGKKKGITKGMGVINNEGVIGIIVSSSDNYSLAASILHSQSMISAKNKRTNTLGTVHWPGIFVDEFELNYIPRHIKLSKKDTIVTSSYNSIFPENIPIGIISEYALEKNSSFYDIKIKLLPNIANLNYVYIVENIYKEEQIDLEKAKNE